VALAAALSNQIDCRDKRVVVVLTGGNADAASYARWIT
jgi:threonine dehydratase